jgi:ABC-type spermidine/putrescine transport system permease subunit II
MLCWASTVATTAAVPAVYAKQRAEGRLSKALAVRAVVPITVRRVRVASARAVLTGERRLALRFVNGEGVGVSLTPAPRVVASLMRALDGVSDIASSRSIEEKESDG